MPVVGMLWATDAKVDCCLQTDYSLPRQCRNGLSLDIFLVPNSFYEPNALISLRLSILNSWTVLVKGFRFGCTASPPWTQEQEARGFPAPPWGSLTSAPQLEALQVPSHLFPDGRWTISSPTDAGEKQGRLLLFCHLVFCKNNSWNTLHLQLKRFTFTKIKHGFTHKSYI